MTTAVRRPLDISDPLTFDRWCGVPAYDTRTLEEFAADVGYPVFPPNRDIREGDIYREDRRALRDELPPIYPDDD